MTPGVVHVVIAGATGRVGSALVLQLQAQGELLTRQGVHVRLDPFRRGDRFAGDAFLRRVQGHGRRRSLFVDCTASDDVASRYAALFEAGVGVVTPNKRANAAPFGAYRHLLDTARRCGVPYRYETTVGAALPVIDTLRSLVERGDRVHRIEALLSGTLSYVFARVSAGALFSTAVREAHALGYSEPHPRDDLAGADVARKMLLLAREAGRELDAGDIPLEALVSDCLLCDDDPASFLARLPEADEQWAARLRAARTTGAALAYVATLEGGAAHVGVREVAGDSALANAQPGENVIVLWTDHYATLPLVVRGPGAGPVVTAAGVLTDIIGAVRSMTQQTGTSDA